MRAISLTLGLLLAAAFSTAPDIAWPKGVKSNAVRCAEVPEGTNFDPTSVESMQAALAKSPPIFRAVNNPTQLVQLLASRPNLNTCSLGLSPLMLATAVGNAETAAMLLDAGARADSPRASSGGTALHTAVSLGRWDTARLLLSRGADALLVTDGGTSVLHEMAVSVPPADEYSRGQQLEMAREFIRRGVPVDGASGVNKSTPLMLAAVSGNRDLVALLLERGANPQLTNKRGESALSFARRKNHEDIVRLLEQAPARPAR